MLFCLLFIYFCFAFSHFFLTFPFWFMLSVFEYFCFLSGCSMYYFLNYLIFVCLKNTVTLPSDLHSFWWELCCNAKCSASLLIAKVLSLSLFQNFLCIFFPECFRSLTIILFVDLFGCLLLGLCSTFWMWRD